MIGRIPFKLPDDGLHEVEGFVYLADGLLVLDMKRAFLGLGEGDRTVVKVAPSALIDVSLARGLMRDKLQIYPRRLELLEAVPGKHAREVVLRIHRKHRPWAEDLVHDVLDWIETDEA